MGHRPDKRRVKSPFLRGRHLPAIWPVIGGSELFVSQWVLKIELNGEWEECHFPTRQDALSAFLALNADYRLERAILFHSGGAGFGHIPVPRHTIPALHAVN
jgi:hypothetical protein